MGLNFKNNQAWIQNDNLFSGSKIYLNANSITLNHQNLTSYKPTTKVDVSQTGETIGGATNIDRRKGVNTYNGMNAMTFTVNGKIDLYELGSAGNNALITPAILYTLIANGHRTYNFMDSKIGSSLVSDPEFVSGVQTPYTGSGIPVILDNYNINTTTSENIMSYTLVWREDE